MLRWHPKNINATAWWLKEDGITPTAGYWSSIYLWAFDEGNSRYLGIFYDDGEELVREPTLLFPEGKLVIPKGGSYEFPSEPIIGGYPQTGRKCWLYRIKVTGGNRTYTRPGASYKTVNATQVLIPEVPGYVQKRAGGTSSYAYDPSAETEYEYAIQDGTILIPPIN